MQVRTYIRPASLADALHTLATVEEPIAIIAGGTDVLVYAREDDRYANSALIDIYGLTEELGQIREEGDDLIIGAWLPMRPFPNLPWCCAMPHSCGCLPFHRRAPGPQSRHPCR